jgi:hypothetical protein
MKYFLILFLFITTCYGKTIYVDKNGTQTPPYDTLAKAFQTITAATADAVVANGDTVLVNDGIYSENTITLKNRSIVLKSINGYKYCEIKPLYNQKAFILDNANCIIAGFKFENPISGWSLTGDTKGGSIYISNGSVINCYFNKIKPTTSFSYSTRYVNGGAIYIENASGGMIERCYFYQCQPISQNQNNQGGAIYMTVAHDFAYSIIDSTFDNCLADNAGAIYMNGGNIRRCIFKNNRSSQGGAIKLRNNGRIWNTKFESNIIGTSPEYGNNGAAIYADASTTVYFQFSNLTIYNNIDYLLNSQNSSIFGRDDAALDFRIYNLIGQNNYTNDVYIDDNINLKMYNSCYTNANVGSYYTGNNNIRNIPNITSNGVLRWNSLCIDSGTTNLLNQSEYISIPDVLYYDLNKKRRIQGKSIDMGAIEYYRTFIEKNDAEIKGDFFTE